MTDAGRPQDVSRGGRYYALEGGQAGGRAIRDTSSKGSRENDRCYGYASPVGCLAIAVGTGGTISGVRFSGADLSPLAHAWPLLASALDGYFDEATDLLEVPVVLAVSDFQRAVLHQVRSIPPGETKTYAQVAQTIGKPGAARAVGRACAANPVPIVIPCHRVLACAGWGGYQNGLGSKLFLLAHEGGTRAGRAAGVPGSFAGTLRSLSR